MSSAGTPAAARRATTAPRGNCTSRLCVAAHTPHVGDEVLGTEVAHDDRGWPSRIRASATPRRSRCRRRGRRRDIRRRRGSPVRGPPRRAPRAWGRYAGEARDRPRRAGRPRTTRCRSRSRAARRPGRGAAASSVVAAVASHRPRRRPSRPGALRPRGRAPRRRGCCRGSFATSSGRLAGANRTLRQRESATGIEDPAHPLGVQPGDRCAARRGARARRRPRSARQGSRRWRRLGRCPWPRSG